MSHSGGFSGGESNGQSSPKSGAGDGDRTHGIQLGNPRPKTVAHSKNEQLSTADNSADNATREETQLTFDALLENPSTEMATVHAESFASRGRAEGERLKREGMDRAAKNAGSDLLNLARDEVRKVALSRVDRTAHADDAHYALIRLGYEPGILGAAAGQLFVKSRGWVKTTEKNISVRSIAHGNEQTIWKYTGE